MRKTAKKTAVLSLVWAQVAVAGALMADETGSPHQSSPLEPDAANTAYADETKRQHDPSFIIPQTPAETPYIVTSKTATAQDDKVIRTSGRHKVSDLAEEFNTTASIRGLCIAAAAEELLEKIQTSENMSKNDAALLIVKSLTSEQIRALPLKSKTALIGAIDDQTMDGEKFAALKKLYTNTVEDPSFALWDAERQLELAKTVRDNPVLQHARQNWQNMDQIEQITAMRVAADLTIQTYGADIGAKTVPLYFMQYKNENIYGMYLPKARTMFLNLKSPKIPESFDETVSVTIHEALHAYHHQLIDKLDNGTLDQNHPTYKYAQIMQQSYDRYIAADKDYVAYMSNPTERHAWEITYIGRYAGMGPAQSLQRPESDVRMARLIKEHFEKRRDALQDKAVNDNLSCGPVGLRIPRANP